MGCHHNSSFSWDGEEEGSKAGEMEMESGSEASSKRGGESGVDRAESGKLNRIGAADHGEGWLQVVADHAKTATNRVGWVGGQEGFWCWAKWAVVLQD